MKALFALVFALASSTAVAAECVASDYRNRLLLATSQLEGAVPLSWRSLPGEIDGSIQSLALAPDFYDLRFLDNIDLTHLNARDFQAALVAMGTEHTARYLVLPTLDLPEVRSTAQGNLLERLRAKAQTAVLSNQPTVLPVRIDVFDLRRGTLLDNARFEVKADLPLKQNGAEIVFSEADVAAMEGFMDQVAQQVACDRVTFPIVDARDREIEIGAGSELGLRPGDVLDIELVQNFTFGNERRYRTRPISARAEILQVLPERATARVSERVTVLNLQRGDLVVAR